jgi:hypothetical protein
VPAGAVPPGDRLTEGNLNSEKAPRTACRFAALFRFRSPARHMRLQKIGVVIDLSPV